MSAFKNIGVKAYFERYGIKNGLKRGFFTFWPIHIIKDYQYKKILYYRKVYKYLEKKYSCYADTEPEKFMGTAQLNIENPVWVYWAQGFEQAPDIVKKCVSSVKKNVKNEVILIDNEIIDKYLVMPKYIIEKYKKGIISTATYADLIRLSLLTYYGGTWIDATVFLTDELPLYITDSDFFAYRDTFGLIENPALYTNWLMHSKKDNPILVQARNMAFAYFKKENYIREYLWIYMLITIARRKNQDIYVPYANSEYSYLLLNCLDKPFNSKLFSHISGLTSVHKLSYKLTDETFKSKGTFYNYIVNQ